MISFIYSFIVLAVQPSGGSGGPPPPPRPGYGTDGIQLPVDENIWILIAVGIVFGMYMVYRRNHSTNKVS